MARLSLLWKYFTRNKTFYRGDHSHHNAWCNSSISAYIRSCQDADRQLATTDASTIIQEESQLEIAG
jgi:hypothetical protein